MSNLQLIERLAGLVERMGAVISAQATALAEAGAVNEELDRMAADVAEEYRELLGAEEG